MRVLIVGCGYVGLPLGKALLGHGHEVFGVRRNAEACAELQSAGIHPLAADITRPDDMARLGGPYDWVVNLISAGGGGVEAYRQVYREGTRNLLSWLRASPPKKFLYTSSTGVYGQTDGHPVKEESPTEPGSDTGRVLVETERLLLQAFQEHHFPIIILRLAGIYGPNRGYWFRQFLKHEARLEGHGERLMNMVHRDDVVGAIQEALADAHPGAIYNVVDDEPVTQLRYFRWLADTLGWPLPPVDPNPPAHDPKRGWSNKKVLNRRLKMELGYQFKYPTFREGLTVEIQQLEAAGLLDTSAAS